ncbi:hypothetical protein ACEQ8H_000271 [Pleosporales sp. CAS-2024a]
MEDERVPPSSPPHAAFVNAPDSPFFPPRNHAPSPKSSSPPPLFSSDDSRESADLTNYESPRIFKNKRKGAWWDTTDSAHYTPEAKKTKMTRNFDSGVYMMSDSTDSSESLLPPHRPPFGVDGTVDLDDELDDSSNSVQSFRSNEGEVRFCDQMERGLEQNSQAYDFSGQDYADSDIRRIGQLASVIKNVDPGSHLPVEGQYRSMVPELYVDLSSNQLHVLTSALFQLQSLTTLVLTDNRIHELPPQIGQLRNLREFHISRNPIKWLPIDMLPLFMKQQGGKLEIFADAGVPWLWPEALQKTPTQAQWALLPGHESTASRDMTGELIQATIASLPNRDQSIWVLRYMEIMSGANDASHRPSGPWNPHDEIPLPTSPSKCTNHVRNSPGDAMYMFRTPVSYFNESGHLLSGSYKPPQTGGENFNVITQTIRGAHGVPDTWFMPPHTKAIKSLATLSLHSALRSKNLEGLTIADLLDRIGDPVPPAAEATLMAAERNEEGGRSVFRKCYCCHGDYVVPRAEWVAWWCSNNLAPTRSLPFKIQVCSWGCVPDSMVNRPAHIFSWDKNGTSDGST